MVVQQQWTNQPVDLLNYNQARLNRSSTSYYISDLRIALWADGTDCQGEINYAFFILKIRQEAVQSEVALSTT